MKKIALYLLLSFFSAFSAKSMTTEFEIRIQSGSFTPEVTTDFEKAIEPQFSEQNQNKIYRLIQFYEIPTADEKERITNAGIELISYIPNKAFISRIGKNTSTASLMDLNIRSIILIEDTFKLSPKLTNTELPSWALVGDEIKLSVKYYSENDKSDLIEFVDQNEGKVIVALDEINVLYIQYRSAEMGELTSHPLVQWIEPIAPPSTKDDLKGATTTRSNALNTAYSSGRKYDGTGVVLALGDDGIIGPHIDFEGRLTNHSTNNNGNHGDMTSGIFFGAGNLDPTIPGMAPGADLHIYSIGLIGINGYPHILNGVANLNTLGTVITSSSYSQGTGGVYTTDSEFTDQQISQNEMMMHVFSAGNSGTFDHGYGAGAGWGNISGGAKAGKNVICAGNVNHLDALDISSSRGPAADGRIKPDLCAYGIGQLSTNTNNTYQVGSGTSASTPAIAGVFAQLFQAYKENNGGVEPESALLKASLLNTAEDLGNPGPDFKNGWGRINGLKAVRIIEDNTYFRDSITQGGSNSHSIIVPANVSQVRIMTYWTDVEGNPAASIALVNDINMQVVDPSNVTYNPWVLDHSPNVASLNANATTGVDNLNNMEQITIDNPSAGAYTVNLSGFAIPQGPQKYFVVYELVYNGVELTYPIGGEGFAPGETEVLRWEASDDTGDFSLEYSTDGGNSYATISNVVSSTSRSFSWVVPSMVEGDVRLRVSRGAFSSESDTSLTIVEVPQNLTIASVCPDSIELTWDNVPGVSLYEISMLGNKYMDAIGTSTTNSFKVYSLNPNEEHWFSVRSIVTGNKGRRAIAINQAPGTANCALDYDIDMAEVLSPAEGVVMNCGNLSAKDITVQLVNLGLSAASNVQLKYQANGGTVVSEILAGPISVGASFDFTFSTPLDMSTSGNYDVLIWIEWGPDQNSYNDTINLISEVLSGNMITLPYTENFNAEAACAITTNCELTTCPLSNGWANLDNYTADNIDWRVDAGGTTSTDTGPTADYDLGTAAGNYLYLESSSSCDFQEAILLSPCIDLSGMASAEFEFAYHMYGIDIGELHLDVITNNGIIQDVMTPIIGNQGDSWFVANIDLAPYLGDTINFRIRGITGDGFHSDIAIDAVSLNGSGVGMNEGTFEATSVIYYPVPSEGLVNLNISGLETEQLQLTILDIDGREILNETHIISGTQFNHQIDLAEAAKGVYIVRLNSSKGSRIDRVVLR